MKLHELLNSPDKLARKHATEDKNGNPVTVSLAERWCLIAGAQKVGLHTNELYRAFDNRPLTEVSRRDSWESIHATLLALNL